MAVLAGRRTCVDAGFTARAASSELGRVAYEPVSTLRPARVSAGEHYDRTW